ncbi:glycosyltransferase family 4 protein [Flammeovirga kamogawensis]|uniref:Glycosyltransferase family 4 protein n=1 Tax=Flammeovirga kamogawensis TaxID=373891 RepID=A0ABX8GWZ6_9BACT|nr:glycosyltransferase family 4 protein [Flammeovirga kamogawensis]MBB6460748.1 glycosyltransferase involved in cell wall biosynthesis [Flammeovirga kamogawensis]QWG08101.1 glycosyltransferase family 4 protein [Flammeovirga kamogawensis]TRX69904.1 glycosyltransferase family 4 protein [Flammeovirga kamogawensis]
MILYIISDIDKAIAFELIAEKFSNDISFIILNKRKGYLDNYLLRNNVRCYSLTLMSKKDYPLLFLKILILLFRIRPKVVHTHLRDANFLGLVSAWLLRIRKRIYTRHSSTFNKDLYPKSVKYDKLCNYLATDVVAISQNVKEVLLEEGCSKEKINLIHHGFDLDAFTKVNEKDVTLLKKKYDIPHDSIVIGVIARYLKLKGHIYIIEAFKKLRQENPNFLLVLANTSGQDKNTIQNLLKSKLDEGSYVEIAFENNLFALYKCFDFYIHTPINKEIEAFGQTYVEALAAGIPSIFTLSGIAPEFIKDKQNALVVPFCDSDAIYNAMKNYLRNNKLQKTIITNGIIDVKAYFSLNLFFEKLNSLYE